MFWHTMVGATAVLMACGRIAAAPAPVRATELRNLVGREVTVKARTGHIKEADEKQTGTRVFTARDDYDAGFDVRSTLEYPIMGATFFLTGTPRVDAATGNVYLEEKSRRRAYPPTQKVVTEVVTERSKVPVWLLGAVAALVVLGIATVVLIVRRRAVGTALPEPWGQIVVEQGPDRGKVVSLRYDEILVGREGDDLVDVLLPMDAKVSRNHGKIWRDDGGVFYEHVSAQNVSSVNEQPVAASQRVPLESDALITVGAEPTVLRFTFAGAGAGAQETVLAGAAAQETVLAGAAAARGSEDPTVRAPQAN